MPVSRAQTKPSNPAQKEPIRPKDRPSRTPKTSARTPMSSPPASVDEYLSKVPEAMRAALEDLRKKIKAAAPEAVEVISYQIPTFKLRKPLVAMAAFKGHCSFFVMSTAVMAALEADLSGYDTAKGTIHFKADCPLPAALVSKIVQARIAENEGRSRS